MGWMDRHRDAAPSEVDPHAVREAVAWADEKYGGPLFWQGPDGRVHRVAARAAPMAEIIGDEDEAWLLFTACGLPDVPEGSSVVAVDEEPTCPRCWTLTNTTWADRRPGSQ